MFSSFFFLSFFPLSFFFNSWKERKGPTHNTRTLHENGTRSFLLTKTMKKTESIYHTGYELLVHNCRLIDAITARLSLDFWWFQTALRDSNPFSLPKGGGKELWIEIL